jgi:hypothetical protein
MKFYRPVGAVRDIRELEFLVALHQTEHNDMQAWTDGSIDGKRRDIPLILKRDTVTNGFLRGLFKSL